MADKDSIERYQLGDMVEVKQKGAQRKKGRANNSKFGGRYAR